MQLAMASPASHCDPDKEIARKAKLTSFGGGDRFAAGQDEGHTAESLFRRYYWVRLDTHDSIDSSCVCDELHSSGGILG